MIRKLDIADLKTAGMVLNIQLPAYKIEAELIGFHEIPPLKDTIDTLQQCDELFYGYYIDDELCGAISLKVEGRIIDIHRLMVHPKHFRRGIARELVDSIEAIYSDYDSLIVSTGTDNDPAINFYERRGFLRTSETIVADRLSLTSFMKKI